VNIISISRFNYLFIMSLLRHVPELIWKQLTKREFIASENLRIPFTWKCIGMHCIVCFLCAEMKKNFTVRMYEVVKNYDGSAFCVVFFSTSVC